MTKLDSSPATAYRPLSHRRTTTLDRFFWGVAYYPEHWPEDQWVRHAELMVEAGVNLARLAEFTWDRLEPARGEFDFIWLDRAIDVLQAHGIDVMLCTPTATPPRWLTQEDPGVLRVGADGQPMQHGSRQHASHCHEGFRADCRRISQAMGQRYRDHPAVVGWQTDNEMHCQFSEDHSDASQAGFREWCRLRYNGDINELNEEWGTSFWSQTYNSFEALVTPRDMRPAFLNPAHYLAFCRFLSDAAADFQYEQIEVLRESNPTWWLTHNGMFDHIDYRGRFTRDLDFLSYDTYPMFYNDPKQRPSRHAFNLDRARGWSGNFFVPEHQVGAGGQTSYMLDSPAPREMQHFMMRTLARGADGVMGFRWRSCPFGAEQYWQGIIDHHGVPGARYEEFAAVGKLFRKLGPELLGTWVHAEAAVAGADVDVVDGFSGCSLGLHAPDYMAALSHEAIYAAGVTTGIVHPTDDLSDIKLFVIPHWPMFDGAWVEPLREWVKAGGTLVIGAITATRDMSNNVVLEPAPGVLAELAGVRVDAYARINDAEFRPALLAFEDGATDDVMPKTSDWREALAIDANDKSMQVVARWSGSVPAGWYDGRPAITRKILGRGSVVYVGTYLTTEVLREVMPRCVGWAELKPTLDTELDCVEAVIRTDGRRSFLFVLNTSDRETAALDWPSGWSSYETPAGQDENSGLTLAPLEVAVLLREDLG